MIVADDRVLNILLVEDDEVDVMNVRRAFDKNKILNPLYVATNAPEGTRILCQSCSEGFLQRLPSLRRDEASSADIRRHVRHVLTDRPRVCAHCGYAWHVETVHLRPVDDFPPDATLATIDDPANLAYLCPNHRWEYEHGFITLDPTTIAPVRSDTGRHPPTPTPRKRPLRHTAVASH